MIAAGALHDTIEKTDTDASELRKRFGTGVARLVVAVSEDERIASYAERKAALRNQAADAGEEALMLLAADKVSKARELRLYPAAARRSRRRRLTHYRDCLCLLQERLPDSPLVRELEMELEALSLGEMSEPALAGASRGAAPAGLDAPQRPLRRTLGGRRYRRSRRRRTIPWISTVRCSITGEASIGSSDGSARGRTEMAGVLAGILDVFDRFELAPVLVVKLGLNKPNPAAD